MFPLCNSEMGLGVHSDRTIQAWRNHQRPPAGGGCLAAPARGLVPLNVPGTRPVVWGRDSQDPGGSAYEHAWRGAAQRAQPGVRGSERAPPGRKALAEGAQARAAGAARDGPQCARADGRADGAGARLRSAVRVGSCGPRGGRSCQVSADFFIRDRVGEREGVLAARSLRPSRR